MAAHVEARSLSELNYLAANPPQYPVNPAQEQQEPLTLYISRVPGTRDVILSTFKPQRKNVTGEDIANSLYYVHLDQLSDDHLAVPPPVAREPSPRSSTESARSINRKALPATLPAAAPPTPGPDPALASPSGMTSSSQAGAQHSFPPSSPPPAYALTAQPQQGEGAEAWVPPGFRMEQAPTLGSISSPSLPPRPPVHQQLPQQLPSIRRKPLAARSVDASAQPSASASQQPSSDIDANPSLRPPISTQNPSEYSLYTNPTREPVHGPTPGLPRTPNVSRAVGPQQSGSASQPQHPTRPHPNLVPFGLTIIRRDPSSGNQWNVGKVSSYQWEAPEWRDLDPDDAALRQSYPADQPGITVHLQTSGYAKFRGLPARQSLDPHMSTSSLHGGRDAESGFTRQVVMSYGRTWTNNVRSVFKGRHRSYSTDENTASFDLKPPHPPALQEPGHGHGRNNSTSSNESVHSPTDDADGKKIITQAGPGLRPKGYVFFSPWDGACEFRTGSGGRSLKCRHTLPSSGGTFNPLVLAQDVRDGRLGRGRAGSFTSAVTGSASVSELRFNLPSAELFAGKGSARELLPAGFDKFLKLEPRRTSMSGDEDDDGPYGLDMGKERAGGGNRGKRAKLGKLIVYPEGLKMMDLVVATNIGIWWGAWEKSF